jgi:two-component system, sensor histidine kinase
MNETQEYTVLNVDDDEGGRYAKTRILQRAGYKVVDTASGADALRLVKAAAPQLVLLDVMLPDINGLEVCRAIKTDPNSAHIMVLQISATHVTGADRIQGLEGGADTYLTEPVEAGELLATVKALLRLYSREEENRRLLAQLRDADRLKDEFLAMLAHELRNPLHPIRSAVDFMRLRGSADPELQSSREILDHEVGHLTRLIDDLMDVSRITHNRIELRKARLSLVDVLKSAVESARPIIDFHGHRLHLDFQDNGVAVSGDEVRLTQIFINLLNNASKYTPNGGQIWLSTRSENGDAVVSIKDSGVGISADKMSRLFEMFYQVDHSMGRSADGLGIGLTLAQRLVELHGGTIRASSGGPGKGSEFVVRLPACPTAVVDDREDKSSESGLSRRILVADDSPLTIKAVSMVWRSLGHEVESAHDGLRAVETAASFRPDVVVLDVGMPGLNGYEACQRIRTLPGGNDMVMIAVTGWGHDEARRNANKAGFDGLLVKPVHPEAILQMVDNVLAHRESTAGVNRTSITDH